MIVNSFVCDFYHCCFFYPLRKGLLVWGYLNLARYCVLDGISTSISATRIQFHFRYPDDRNYQDLLSITLMFTATLLLSLANLAFNIIFVVGTHKRDERLLRSHYFYWMVTLAIYILFYVGSNIVTIFSGAVFHWMSLHVDPVTFHMALVAPFVGMVDICVQIYFLILVRNQIRAISKGDQRAIIDDYYLESRNHSRPQSMSETVRNVIDTQPRPNSNRF